MMANDRPVVEGLDRVMGNLNREVGKIVGRTIAGLLAGGLIIQAEAQRRVPVDTGNLKGSAFTRKDPNNDRVVETGFNAAYAIFVHENLEAHHDNGEAKYLENAVTNKQDEVVKAIVAYGRGSSE